MKTNGAEITEKKYRIPNHPNGIPTNVSPGPDVSRGIPRPVVGRGGGCRVAPANQLRHRDGGSAAVDGNEAGGRKVPWRAGFQVAAVVVVMSS
ncbi:hypothetical protein GWI33_012837 [Rhynchophorus ferrugineus]|uniref:Uncharacterized protein n=1 Tax=Rhynchophorus ferrugineus TaxID=354439 RepID=A0A834M778_RHYFE|nr:hypothetical protein GWI33_012837 [Rhynchophorus ferrugineus]